MSLQPNNNKSLLNLFEEEAATIFRTLNCVKIGEIQSFDTVNQTATIKILHKKVNEYNLETRELEDYSLLEQVPVIVMGGGSSYISYPISPGDNCLILFNDFEIDGWWSTGEALPENFSRRHDLSDAIAIVGLHSLVSLIQNYSPFLNLHYSAESNIIVGEDISINNEQTTISGKLTVEDDITGEGKATAELHSTNGATGSFVTVDQKTVTVVDGIITAIV